MIAGDDCTHQTVKDMDSKISVIELSDDEIVSFHISDEALEAAASATEPLAAMSFPNAPTVSILIMCCGNG
jgi:hypothetical protein